MTYSNAFAQLLRHTSPQKGKVVFAILCSALNKICDIVPEMLIGVSINIVVSQKNSVIAYYFGIQNPYQQLYVIGGFTALLWIFESIFEYCYSIAWRGIAQNIQHELRIATYTKWL